MGEVMYTMYAKWGNIITYVYGDEDFAFSTHLFSEVGVPYRKWFLDEIVRRGWIVRRGVAFEEDPYCADILYGKAREGEGYVNTSY